MTRINSASRGCSLISSKWRKRGIAGRGAVTTETFPADLGQDRSGQLQPLFEANLDLAELVPDHDLVGRRQLNIAHQAMDEVAIAGIGRYPPAGGVQVLDVAGRFKFGHLVADRRRGNPQRIPLGDGLRTDGAAGVHVFLDDDLEDGTLPRREVLKPSRGIQPIHSITPPKTRAGRVHHVRFASD